MSRSFANISICLIGLLLLGPALAYPLANEPAAAAPESIVDYDHVAWTQKDGAPAGIWAIAQSGDGWLWLGTASGLFRFDGLSFTRHDLLPVDSHRSRSVLAIVPMASGDLMSWGHKGPGRWITVYAHGSHAYVVIAGLRFDTSMHDADAPGPSTGPRWSKTLRRSAAFVARHPGSY